MIDGRSLAAAAAIAVLTTVCCAWRWSLVARGSRRRRAAAHRGRRLLPFAVPQHDPARRGARRRAPRQYGTVATSATSAAACGLSRGSAPPDRSCRSWWPWSCCWSCPSPVRSYDAGARDGRRGGGAGPRPRRPASLPRRVAVGTGPAARLPPTSATGCSPGGHWPASRSPPSVVVAGHAATFLIAARTAGASASTARMLPLALLVLLAMGVPTNIAGWGPREGVAAWAFAAAGLGAAQGVATAVVYGVDGARRQPARRRGARRRMAARRAPAGPAEQTLPVRPPRRRRPWKARPVAERPYTLLSCGMSIDGYLDSAGETAAAALQRGRLRPRRRRARRLRRDPGRRGHRPERQPAAAGARRRRDSRSGWPAGFGPRR